MVVSGVAVSAGDLVDGDVELDVLVVDLDRAAGVVVALLGLVGAALVAALVVAVALVVALAVTVLLAVAVLLAPTAAVAAADDHVELAVGEDVDGGGQRVVVLDHGDGVPFVRVDVGARALGLGSPCACHSE